MSDKDIKVCDTCGASVYPEHIASGRAAAVGGKMRCPLCLDEYKKTHHADETRYEGQTTTRAPGEGVSASPVALSEEEVPPLVDMSSTEIKAFGTDSLADGAIIDESRYTRPLIKEGFGGTRCRTFHAKLNDGAVAYMNKQIDDWADAHPDVVIKSASTTIGVWEGKKADPHLIVTVIY